jgi:hypothetical protein
MFWSTISVLSIVASALFGSAAPRQADGGAVLVAESPLQYVGPQAPASGAASRSLLEPSAAGETGADAAPLSGEWRSGALLYAPAGFDSPSFRAAVAELLGAPVDYFDAYSSTPTVRYMMNYTAVMTWADCGYASATVMGDNLADFVDAGGRVILGQGCRQSDQDYYLTGRIMDDPAYCPVLACSTSFEEGRYHSDGILCPHDGPYGVVGAHRAGNIDVVTVLAPGACTDGTIGSSYDAVWNSTGLLWYSPGNTGGRLGSGDWDRLTANMVVCPGNPGACCDISSAACIDDVAMLDCLALGDVWRPHPDVLCEALVPPCGGPGACCDVYTGACLDEILKYNCEDEFHRGQHCAQLVPACGDPGCCCDGPESGTITEPYTELAALCSGRFASDVSPADCVAAVFTPACGLWAPAGLLYAPGTPDDPPFRASVAGLLNAPVGYFDARADTPTLELLMQYRACMTFLSYGYHYADSDAMGDVLADYIDAGGRVILGQQCRASSPNVSGLSGRIMDDPAYCPVLAVSTDYSSGCYSQDGTGCVHNGQYGVLSEYCATWLDIVSALAPGALTDGTIDGTYGAVWRPDMRVWYSPGNKGFWYGSTGQWDLLTANMVVCQPTVTGACCDLSTAECLDELEARTCADHGPQWRFHCQLECADLDPPCGNPGACCDDDTATCTDVLEFSCAGRFISGADCATAPFLPPCGSGLSMLYAPANPDNPAYRDEVAALIGGPVDYFDVRLGTPTLEQLSQYTACMVWINFWPDDCVALGDVLADYVDAGGRVILGQWCRCGDAGCIYLSGRIMDDPAYCPALTSAGGYYYGAYSHDGVRCVHRGRFGLVMDHDTDYLDYITELAPGAVSDGTFDSTGNPPAAIWRPDMHVWYSPGNTGASYGSGDWARLTANMISCMPNVCGDINCDGAVNAFDVDPFVQVLTWSAGPPPTTWPYCGLDFEASRGQADLNGDGMVNVFDIDPFVECLTAGGCGPCR